MKADYFLTGSDPELLEYLTTETNIEEQHDLVKSYDQGKIIKCPGRILLLEDDNLVTYAITYSFGSFGSGEIHGINVWTRGCSKVISHDNAVTIDIYDELFSQLQSIRVEASRLSDRFWHKRLVRDFHIGRLLIQEKDGQRILIDDYDYLCDCLKMEHDITADSR